MHSEGTGEVCIAMLGKAICMISISLDTKNVTSELFQFARSCISLKVHPLQQPRRQGLRLLTDANKWGAGIKNGKKKLLTSYVNDPAMQTINISQGSLRYKPMTTKTTERREK